MTYFSDFDYQDNFDDEAIRKDILRNAEYLHLEYSQEYIPEDLLSEFDE